MNDVETHTPHSQDLGAQPSQDLGDGTVADHAHQPDPARLVTIEHAAEMLDTSTRMIERLLDAGELHRVRIGSQAVRIRAVEIVAFIERHIEGQ